MLQPGYRIERYLNASGDGPLFGLVRAFIKPQVSDTFEIANEYICAKLAHAIGLPCPPGDFATVSEPPELAWITPLALQDAPPPVDPEDVRAADPEVCTGILVFDTWVLNLDRHDWNVIFSPNSGTWIIDHGQALFYRGSDPANALGSTKSQTMSSTHLFSGYSSPKDVADWCEVVSCVGERTIRSAIQPVLQRGLIDEPHADALLSFLTHRARNIDRLLPPGALPPKEDTQGVEGP